MFAFKKKKTTTESLLYLKRVMKVIFLKNLLIMNFTHQFAVFTSSIQESPNLINATIFVGTTQNQSFVWLFTIIFQTERNCNGASRNCKLILLTNYSSSSTKKNPKFFYFSFDATEWRRFWTMTVSSTPSYSKSFYFLLLVQSAGESFFSKYLGLTTCLPKTKYIYIYIKSIS